MAPKGNTTENANLFTKTKVVFSAATDENPVRTVCVHLLKSVAMNQHSSIAEYAAGTHGIGPSMQSLSCSSLFMVVFHIVVVFTYMPYLCVLVSRITKTVNW